MLNPKKKYCDGKEYLMSLSFRIKDHKYRTFVGNGTLDCETVSHAQLPWDEKANPRSCRSCRWVWWDSRMAHSTFHSVWTYKIYKKYVIGGSNI